MKTKPGVMIYFELRGMLKLLPDAEKGILFDAILEYGQTGKVGELTDTLRVAWPLIKMRLDTDSDRYTDVVNKRRYAAYVRWAKQHNDTVLSYPVWLREKSWEEDSTDPEDDLPYPS